MNLLPPRILGPVSECSDRVWIQGQLPGSTVEVEDNFGNIVASDTVSSGDAVITLSASLVAGQRLAARQQLGSDDSGLSLETVEVQKRPDPLGPGIFSEIVFRCARCIWVDGLLPGAEVKLVQGSSDIGTGRSIIGFARVGLSVPLSGNPLVLEQEACGVSGEPRTIVPVEPPHGEEQGRLLPPPVIESPLQECRTRVTISNILPGATVDLERSMGPNGTACFDRSSLWWGMNPPLVLGEAVRASQAFLDCEKFSLFSSPPVPVEPLQPVPVPELLGPLCAEASSVRICNLLADARVKIIILSSGHHGVTGGDEYFGTAPEDGCFDFPIPAPGLPAGGMVCATQELCSRESIQSEALMVEDAPEALPKPIVQEPLFACSITVRVSNLHRGTRVYVAADGIGVIGEAHVTDDKMDITVRPALIAGWQITAWAIGCGQESDKADPVEVNSAPEQLPPPKIMEPVHSCDRSVTVTELIPGASVDLYVNGIWAGRGMAGAEEDNIGFAIGPLQPGDQVYAVQQLCEVESRPGESVTVIVFDGEWEVLRDGSGNIIEDKTGILAVHVALLPSNWIVIFSGDDYTRDGVPIDNTRVMLARPPWTVEKITGIPDDYNLFCCGHSMLADGSVLTGGGTFSRPPSGFHGRNREGRGGHWLGLRGSLRFREASGGVWEWEIQGDMVTARPDDVRPGFEAANSGGRWYPTLVTLPDGKVLAIGGHPLDGDWRHTNTSLEIYDPASNIWSIVGTQDYNNIPGRDEGIFRSNHSEYPGLHVLPDNTVFAASSMQDGNIWKWNISNNATDWTFIDGTPTGYVGNPQPITSVLLPLRHDRDYLAEVLLLGRAQAHTIRPSGTSPGNWTPTAARTLPGQPPRIYPLATLLPTGEVLVSGGTETARDSTALLEPEIYDPATGTWRHVEVEANQIRNYHSSALLLPDGSVWHSGGNEDCNPSSSSNDTRNRTVEIFRPWYFCWPRPRIGMVTDRVCHGETFSVRTHDAVHIFDVVLVRLSSFTHAFNPDQRLVSISFRRDPEDGERLICNLPSNPAIAIVGYYMCFILDENRVPSHGLFMQVCSAGGSSSKIEAKDGTERLIKIGEDLIKLQEDFGRILAANQFDNAILARMAALFDQDDEDKEN